MKLAISLLGIAALGIAGGPAAAQQDTGGAMLRFEEAGVDMTIDELQRTDAGATVLLRATVRNPSPQGVELGHLADMSLTDYRNRRKYLVITDSSLACTCAPAGAVTAAPGGTIHLWAKFPAPPEGITTVSLGWGAAVPAAVRIAP